MKHQQGDQTMKLKSTKFVKGAAAGRDPAAEALLQCSDEHSLLKKVSTTLAQFQRYGIDQFFMILTGWSASGGLKW